MPYTLLQVGTSLKSINSDGALSSALTLPSGVTLASNLTPRFAKFEAGLTSYAVLVNTPTIPVSVDANGVVRYLSPPAPASAVAAVTSGGGVLSGNYLYLQAFVIKDSLGNDISVSGFSPLMSSPVVTANNQVALTLLVSPAPYTAISARRIYRTTTNGGVYFPLVDINDNTTTTYTDNATDASLSTIAAPSLGSAPDLTLIAEFAGRLWSVSRSDVDHLIYTEAGTMYAWNALNTLAIPHIGSDAAGVTSLIPRRDALGVARRDMLLQVTGTDRTNFRPVVVNGGENVGCVSQESVVVFNDVAYFLFRDGVYKWDSSGVTCISNGTVLTPDPAGGTIAWNVRGNVRSWFTSDTYFNRSMFWRAFAQFDPVHLKYRLFLATTGSNVINSWVEYDIVAGSWWGIHNTSAFTPSCAVTVPGVNQQPYAMIGSVDGYLSRDQEPRNDWNQPIAFDVTSKAYDMKEPDREKYFGELSINGPIQPSGKMVITPTVGELTGAVPQTPFNYDMTQGRQRLPRLGVGKELALEFTHAVADEDVVIYGFEINPVNLVGRR